MNIPTHLKHKPIIAVENYDRIDGFEVVGVDLLEIIYG